MAKMKCAVALTAVLSGALALPRNTQPYQSKQDLPPAEERTEAVVDAFRTAWEGYYKYAFPNDELLPVSNTFGNSRYVCLHIAVELYQLTLTEMDGVLLPWTLSVPHWSWGRKTSSIRS